MRKKRTSAVGTCHVLHLGQFFWWIEGKRLKVRDKTYSSSDLGEQVLSMDKVVVENHRWLASCDSSYSPCSAEAAKTDLFRWFGVPAYGEELIIHN